MNTIAPEKLDANEKKIALQRFVAESDKEWFDNFYQAEGLQPAGLFRRMRVAFERSLARANDPSDQSE